MPQGKGPLVLRTSVQFSVKTRSVMHFFKIPMCYIEKTSLMVADVFVSKLCLQWILIASVNLHEHL